MATVRLEANFEGTLEVTLSKEIESLYLQLLKDHKDVCKYLIEYDYKNKTLSLPNFLTASTGDRYKDKEAQSVLSFFSNSCPYSLGIDALPDNFYKNLYKLFPNISIFGSLFESTGGSSDNFTVNLTEHGLEWEVEEADDNGSELIEDYDPTELILAAAEGDTETMEALLQKGVDIEGKDKEGTTALIYAAMKGQIEAIELLLNRGADLELKDYNGKNALMWAVGFNHTEVAQLLIYKGANIESTTNKGATPLIIAAANGQIDSAKMLIEAGANINVKNKEGMTALMRASFFGFKEVIRFLIDKGASISVKSLAGETALSLAKKEGHTEIVKYLEKAFLALESDDLTLKEKSSDGFAIPKDFDHFHYIACIFKIFADTVGENPSPFVTKKMTELLQEWLPDGLTASKIFTMIQPTLNKLYHQNAGLLTYFLKTATQEIMAVGIFKESNLKSIVSDLVDIAEANGEINANEVKFINRIAQYFGIEFSVTATALGDQVANSKNNSQMTGQQESKEKAEAYYDEGKKLEEDGNYKEALKWYRKSAEQGHAYAQFLLGTAYAEGEGIPVNKKEAAKWYRKSAEQGFSASQYLLAGAYFEGDGVPLNKVEAIKWLKKSAEQGLDAAQFFLGWAFENGEGVHENHQEALIWYKLAAEQDYKDAQKAVIRISKNINYPQNKDTDKVVSNVKRITYATWSDFEFEQAAKDERKKDNLPIAKEIHDLLFNILKDKNNNFEIRYGDGTFSFSIPKSEAKSGKRTFARVGLLSLADKSVYLDTLYKSPDDSIPLGGIPWRKNDETQYLFRMKTIEDFDKVKNSITEGVIQSYVHLAKSPNK